jgi:hypothetical protein
LQAKFKNRGTKKEKLKKHWNKSHSKDSFKSDDKLKSSSNNQNKNQKDFWQIYMLVLVENMHVEKSHKICEGSQR